MKIVPIVLMSVLLLVFSSVPGSAQMGHSMMDDNNSGEMKHKQMMEHKGMTGHEQMMDGMTDKMHEMSGMMHAMSEKTGDMPKEKMHEMSMMMKDMCTEMNRMSGMTDRGTATAEDMKGMNDGIAEMQK